MDSTGHARLSDIGFSNLIATGDSGFDWDQVGTDGCRWAAAEIFQNGELTKQSDVFSYGFIAAEVHLPSCYLVPPQLILTRYPQENSCGRSLIQRK